MNCVRKPSFLKRGFFFFFLFLLLFIKIPYFYEYNYISFEIYILAFIDIFFIYILYIFFSRKFVLLEFDIKRIFCYLAIFICFFIFFSNEKYYLFLLLIFILTFEFLITFIDNKIFIISILLLSFLFLTFSIFEYSFYSSNWFLLNSNISKFLFVGLDYPRKSLIGLFAQQNLSALFLCLGYFSYIYLIIKIDKLSWYKYIPLAYISMGFFLTTSRMAVVAVSLTFFIMILLGYFNKKIILTKILFATFLGYLLSSFIGYSSVERISNINASGAADVSTYMRFNYWFSSLKMGFDNLPFGVGLGGLKRQLGDYTVKTADAFNLGYSSFDQTLWSHNDFLQFFADTGVFAVIVYIFAIYLIYKLCKKDFFKKYRYETTFLSVFFVYANFSYPLHFPPLMIIFIILIAVIYKKYRKKYSMVLSNRNSKSFLALLLVIIVVTNFYFINHFIKSYEYYRFNKSLNRSNVTEMAENFVKKYNQSDINSPYEWLFMNDVIYKLSNYSFFNNKSEVAEIIAPLAVKYSNFNANHTLYYSLAKIFFTMQEYNKAKKYAKIAFNKKPNIDEYYTLMHLSEVMKISKREKIPLIRLMPEDVFTDYEKQGILHKSQYNKNLIVK